MITKFFCRYDHYKIIFNFYHYGTMIQQKYNVMILYYHVLSTVVQYLHFSLQVSVSNIRLTFGQLFADITAGDGVRPLVGTMLTTKLLVSSTFDNFEHPFAYQTDDIPWKIVTVEVPFIFYAWCESKHFLPCWILSYYSLNATQIIPCDLMIAF